jgi:citrate synthase
VPGFGHPIHTRDPRVVRLFELVEMARKEGVVSGRFMQWALLYEQALAEGFVKKKIPLNVDGGGAVVLCETGIPAETAMGFVCLSRGLGLMAHGYETTLMKQRLKSPMPPDLIARHMTYSGPPPRKFPQERLEGGTDDQSGS